MDSPTSIQPEKLLVADALKRRLGYRPSPTTIWRWRTNGVNGVKLQAERCGQKWMTTMDDVEDFVKGQNTPQREESKPEARDEATTRRLHAAGLL